MGWAIGADGMVPEDAALTIGSNDLVPIDATSTICSGSLMAGVATPMTNVDSPMIEYTFQKSMLEVQ